MTDAERRAGIQKFIDKWSGPQKEKQGDQSYWSDMIHYVFGRMDATDIIGPQKDVIVNGHTKNIDVYIPDTRVLIEQKSSDKNLDTKYPQSGGDLLTPYEQAKRYADNLPTKEYPNWIITSNFKEIHIYDMNHREQPRIEILLENLARDYYLLDFLIDPYRVDIKRELEISIKAGDLVGELYNKLLAQYEDPTNEYSLHSLNVLCVRLVFCLYAEDANLFGDHLAFNAYLNKYDPDNISYALSMLFDVLNTPINQRKRNLPPDLAKFPYVNGGLFEDDGIEMPLFTQEIKELLLDKASAGFDWNEISPTIFGAVFESTLNEETRRKGGMHYTSVDNIHKVIDPLFLDDLEDEYKKISNYKDLETKKKRLKEFHDKLSSLTFLDPAVGSGNFLTESYLSLRRLENEVIKDEIEAGVYSFGRGKQIAGTQLIGAAINPIKVSIHQFYGIEINDFAVSVAMTAMWIAESQMQKITEDIIKTQLDFLPLKSYENIKCQNALRYDWKDLIAPSELTYIMGNPPFIGARKMDKDDSIPVEKRHQKQDMTYIFGKLKGVNDLDYVAAWYKKASNYMEKNKKIKSAFVSTNSITQGQQVPILWKCLHEEDVHIDFAYRTFRWDSEATVSAQVHCVIVGFSKGVNSSDKVIFDNGEAKIATCINGYLIDGPDDLFVDERKNPLCDVPKMKNGSMPNDGGHISNISPKDKEIIINQYPNSEDLFRRYIGAKEYLHNKERWCLWLEGVSPKTIVSIPPVKEAVEKVREKRASSGRPETRVLADTPHLFAERRQPLTDYLVVPRHFTESYRYIPIDYMDSSVVCGDANDYMPEATLYSFGVLMSSVLMAWVNVVCGRIKSDNRFSLEIGYNNFPWPAPSEKQIKAIEKTAKGILEARACYPDSSLYEMYGENMYLYPQLMKAHADNNKAVLNAYGFDARLSEYGIVTELMKLYLNIVNEGDKD